MSKLVAVKSQDSQDLQQVLAALPPDVEVIVKDSMPAAIESLRENGAVGILVSRAGVPEMPEAVEGIDPAAVLEAIQDGIMIIDGQFRIVWANAVIRRVVQTPGDIIGVPCYRVFHQRSNVCLSCEALETFRTGRQAKRVHQMEDGGYQETISHPIFNELGQVVQAVLVRRDVSQRVFLQSKIESIYQAGNELASRDWTQMSRMSFEDRIAHIKENVVSHTQKLLTFDSLVIRQLNERTGVLEPMIYVGYSPGEEENLKRKQVMARREDNGITGYVAATGRSYLCRDASTDPLIKDPTTAFGSQISVPLRLNDRVVGTMGVRSKKVWAYTVEDMKFLEIFANFVATALNTANLIRLEHAETYGRVAELIAHDISNPVNAIVNDVYLLLQEYIGHDSNTIAKLKDIEHNVDRVKEVVRRVTDEGRPMTPLQGRAQDEVLKGRRVLVADDDEAIRLTMSDVLSKDGCIVETAGDGLEVIEMMEGNPAYDLVLTDVKMPRRDGYEIFAYVHDHFPDTPVILMTAFGYDPNHVIVNARADGLQAVLFKPFKVTKLRSVLRNAIIAAGKGDGS